MTKIIWIFYFLVIVFLTVESHAEEIWSEQFSVPDKGFWGDPEETSIHSDMDGITQWNLDVSACQLTAESDYVKTTSTSGGRLEAKDCDGEAVWTSELISIKNYKNISVKIDVAETGSGNNISNKYIRVYYQLDALPETLFETNGESAGNFSANEVSQNVPEGENLRIIIRMNNTYASDKLIVDNIQVEGESNVVLTATKISVTSCPGFIYSDEKFDIEAQAVCSDNTVDSRYNKELYMVDQTGNLNIEEPAQIPTDRIYRWENLYASQEGKLSVMIFNNELTSATKEITVEKYYEPTYSFDFEDQQLTGWLSTGDWMVSAEKRINGEFSLRHSPDAVNAESVIFYPVDLNLTAADYRWTLTLKNGKWNPSSSNRFWFYLLSDSLNPESLNGWAVGVNISGNSDIPELWRFKNGTPDSLIVQSNRTWDTNTTYRIEVERRDKGQWSVYTKDLSGNRSQSFTGTDYTVFDFNYIGLHFDFTSSRAGQLWADDISLVEFQIPPYLQYITVKDEDKIEVAFNKKINPALVKTQNFQLVSESGKHFSVLNAEPLAQTPEKIEITVERPDEFKLKLLASDITDEDGLVMQVDSLNFEWILPCTEHSLVINEIFADPNPAEGLPEFEYLEIYNRTSFPVSLDGLILKVGDKTCTLETGSLYPDLYKVLTGTEASALFENSLGLKKFPTLKNSGAQISLETTAGLLVDELTYSDSWYADDDKKNGGWSLERIDPNRFCNQPGNWKASVNEKGGTPGHENSVKDENIDQSSPCLVSLEVLSDTTLQLTFSEEIEYEGLQNKNNFKTDDTAIQTDSVIIISQEEIVLCFSSSFVSKQEYQLVVSNLNDLCSNEMETISKKFVFYLPEENSVVINEIFADPFPAVGLPEYEYIELFNRLDIPIHLQNLQLEIEGRNFVLPDSIITPEGFAVLTSDEGSECYSNAVAIHNFPALRNSEGTIQLVYDQEQLIDQVEYSDSWYQSSEKQDGGWSLERIDNNRFCGQTGNWIASVSPEGGTPGTENSVATDNQDTQRPEITELKVIPANQLRLTFSENIELQELETVENYTITPEVRHPSIVEINDQQEIRLIFSEDFVPNEDYLLSVSGLSDECGNIIESRSYNFELQQLEKGDILISEVLFNPYTGGTDFVELYNHSKKIVNLKKLSLAGRDDQSQLEDICSLTTTTRWLQPGEYVLCTKDSLAVALFYSTSCPECFCETGKFPSYPDDQGTVVVLDDSPQVIDEFQYSEKMHHPLIDDNEGVSLERLSFETSTQNTANWHSAASSVGFATPGYANSQQREELQTNADIVLDPEIFSPNNDGYNDRLLIHYQLEKPGYSANVKVYDSKGRLINYLVKNETLAQEGDWFWDGEKMDSSRSALGIYIVLVELFDMEGNVKRYRKTCVLTDRL